MAHLIASALAVFALLAPSPNASAHGARHCPPRHGAHVVSHDHGKACRLVLPARR